MRAPGGLRQMVRRTWTLGDRPLGLAGHILFGLAALLGGWALFEVITLPLDFTQQVGFAAGAFVGALLLHRLDPTRRANVALAVLSAAISTRYIYWRATKTLHFDNPISLVLGIGLFLAELYAWAILVFGYVQCVWPLPRPVRQIEGPPESWPTVDIFVPTYNESLDIVQDTVLAAMSIDYPPDRCRVFLLDDGRRPEFAAFAKRVGCNYITRDNNHHAKAGNLNNALAQTDGELIVVFDADHVATRAFLQMTAGWFQADPKLALLQTPHFFYSPDPVQRNITAVRDIQGEGALFYGIVQEGNDFWNAAFFCGSAAVVRRSALAQIDGFARETVTEDAHTALRLQRRGWDTAYLNIRLSAGLATERLALHIGQRARWARGMTQIMRIDNPLFGPGLSVWQRFCYFNAMLHFQFPLPRVVFLTAPLCYLLFGQNIIHASPLMIVAFAAPHLLFSHIGNSRIQGNYGRSIWNEVYETILAFHLVGPSFLPLVNPKAGKFNVTEKGGILENEYFDWRSLRPHLIVVFLLLLAIAVASIKLLTGHADADTVILNMFWSIYNIMILLTTLVVGRERRQVRQNLRAHAHLPATLYFEDGHMLETITRDISMGGVALEMPEPRTVEGRSVTHLELHIAGRSFVFPAEPLRIRRGVMSLKFGHLSLENRRSLVLAVFGRADAWPSGEDAPRMTVTKAIGDLFRANVSLFAPPRRFRASPPASRAAEPRKKAA